MSRVVCKRVGVEWVSYIGWSGKIFLEEDVEVESWEVLCEVGEVVVFRVSGTVSVNVESWEWEGCKEG